jgi:tRNA A-37 threonylcarbamoyl transferase component Bud32
VTRPERWREIDRVLDRALDLPPAARAAFLTTACGADAALRAEVERLLRAKDQAGDFLEEPLPIVWPTLVSAARSASPLTAPGALFAERYTIERELGRGGMATVYLARDAKHRRPVAVKILDADLARSAGAAARFLREIEITANLQHPHILPLHDSGELEGLVYYVMPYVAGESLRDRLARERQLPVDEAIGLTRDVASALDYAHRRGVVHRDIKPGNILLEDGQAIVADFGIARAVREAVSSVAGDQGSVTIRGVALGTPTYMSPEQAVGEDEVTRQSDVYSLGCVLYEMLAGAPPFTAPTAEAVIGKHLHEVPRPLRTVRPEVSHRVEEAVARALSKDPGERFASAGDLAGALGTSAAVPIEARWPRRLVATLGWRRAALGGGLLALGAVGVTLVTRRERPPVAAPAAAIAVFPLVPAVPDTALTRLGRELVVTLSASLEGVDGIRTVDALTVLASVRASEDAPALTDAIGLARRLGARSVVYGSVVRVGDNARLDLSLQPTSGAEPLARVSVTASSDDVAALTDSAAWALLRQLWQRSDPPTPSLAAITTRSLPALRAFLDGERLVVGGRWRAAAEAFQLAFTLDSTFWFAYWRYASARQFYAVRVDSAIRAKYLAHRTEFPERDRLLIEAGMSDSLSPIHERVKAITERFPGYWPAWWALSEYLAHTGPLFGTRDSDLRAALERTLELNPHLVSGLDHLLWVALWQRDTVLSGRIIGELTAVRYDSISMQESGGDLLAYYRYLDALARSDGVIRDTATAEAALASLAPLTGPVDLHRFSLGVAHYGFPKAQEQMRPLLARRGPPGAVNALRLTRALSEAQRGAWASALATLDQIVATTPDPIWPLYRYRLAVAAAWLGALDPSVATAQRAAVAEVREQLQPGSRAELAWLDGLLAVARNDVDALAAARRSLAGTDSVTAPFLDRSLGAFALALAGRRSQAADSLTALEHERAELGWSRRRSDSHPFLTAVNRLAAARWLVERGDAVSAERLLTWHQAVLFPLRDTREANVTIEPLAYLEQARVAEVLGRVDLARAYYQRFLWRYDLPAEAHRHLVEEARAALVRLGRQGPADGAR